MKIDWEMYWEGVKRTLTSIRNLYAPVVSGIIIVFLPIYLTTKDLSSSLTIFNTALIIILPYRIFSSIVSLLPTSFTFKGSEYTGYINTRCRRLTVEKIEEKDEVAYVYVKCDVGYLLKSGCPSKCPGFTTISGLGTFGGGVVGGLVGLGLAGGPLGVLGGFILGGIGGTILEEASLSEYEAKTAEIRRKGKKIVIIPILR